MGRYEGVCLEFCILKTQLDAKDFIDYLGIDLKQEAQLSWIARELCCAPLPPDATQLLTKTNLVYFRDATSNLFTVEHPLTQRFLKVLERHRLDAIAGLGKRHVHQLEWTEPDIEFYSEFSHLQVPCSDCTVSQSTVYCHQCISGYCAVCFELLHAKGARKEHTYRPTASGSTCSYCPNKQPQVYCNDCKEYFCFKCFESLHRRGKRAEHKAMHIMAWSGNVASSEQKLCDECIDESASLRCDMCKDAFCLVCFWKCHLNGSRRHHTATQLTVRPLCNQCDETRATLYCEQCQELLCSACFGRDHLKGSRKLHLFTDATNVLLLLEKLDPGHQEFLKSARKKVLNAIMKIQASIRAFLTRERFMRKKEFATVIQKHWRGGESRRRLMKMLDQFNWRKREMIYSVLDPLSESQREKEIQALDSRLRVASKDQSLSISALKSSLDSIGISAPQEERSGSRWSIEYPPRVERRLVENVKESEKLRKLLSINERTV